MSKLRGALRALLGAAVVVAACGCQPPREDPARGGGVPPPSEATAVRSTYRGWPTIALRNGLIEVHVAPDIGGRIIQFRLGEFSYLWVNDQLAGKKPPRSGVGPEGEWLNYGGDKLWPAPQGWGGRNEWPGPPGPVLDGSPHAARIVQESGSPVSVKLTSREDPSTGIQFARLIKIFRGSTRVRMELTMRNIDDKPRRWGIWQVTQHDAASRSGAGHDANVWAYCPMNRKSTHPRGYHVLYGLANNPSFKPDPKRHLMRVHYTRQVGKIGLDSPGGWLAVVHGTSGCAFVARFPHFPGRDYPDASSVEFWINGAGQVVMNGKTVTMADDPVATPSYLESEVLSPFARLWPGQSYSFGVDWYAARIGGNHPVIDCTEVGVTCEEFVAKIDRGRLTLKGRFGVFYQGRVGLRFLNVMGETVGQVNRNVRVSPAEPLVLTGDSRLTRDVRVPDNALKAALVLLDDHERSLGELARGPVEWFPMPGTR